MHYVSRKLSLESGDILDLQEVLSQNLAKIIKFERHSLYFPIDRAHQKPKLLPRERKLLLPLVWEGRQLGVTVLHKVDLKKAHALLGTLPEVCSIILEKLALLRAQSRDELTNLYVGELFYERFEKEAAEVQASEFIHEDISKIPTYKLCRGLVHVRFKNARELGMRFGYSLVDALLVKMAQAFDETFPPEVLVVRLREYEFALLFNALGRSKCREMANETHRALQKVSVTHEVTKEEVSPSVSVGFGLYPQDMDGGEMQLALREQAKLFLERVRLASRIAMPNQVLGYFERVQKGGRILEVLPMGRFRINLGRLVGTQVKPSQAFAVMGSGQDRVYKGDIRIVNVGKYESIAELSYQANHHFVFEEGDCLEYLQSRSEGKGGESESETVSERDFYAIMLEKSKDMKCFTLAMVDIERKDEESFEKDVQSTRNMWKEVFETEKDVLQGRHGNTIVLYFHPNHEARDLEERYRLLVRRLSEKGISLSVGLASYPFLSMSRADMQACAFKALEYAMLLPEPRCGICNSLALNISADRMFSLGDYLGALEEYKRALMADENNSLAWNSMGVCMAAMGRKEDARAHFLEALTRKADSSEIAESYYNLGTLSMSYGETPKAIEYFQKCVESKPKHLYGWIRLGQVYEQAGKKNDARRCYEKGAAIEAGEEYTSTLAKRHLAQLFLRQKRGDEARGLLQEILQKNPFDATSMLLLAKVYRDGDEDPSLVEILARKSLRIQNRKESWELLAWALERMGREDGANFAKVKAGEEKEGDSREGKRSNEAQS